VKQNEDEFSHLLSQIHNSCLFLKINTLWLPPAEKYCSLANCSVFSMATLFRSKDFIFWGIKRGCEIEWM